MDCHFSKMTDHAGVRVKKGTASWFRQPRPSLRRIFGKAALAAMMKDESRPQQGVRKPRTSDGGLLSRLLGYLHVSIFSIVVDVFLPPLTIAAVAVLQFVDYLHERGWLKFGLFCYPNTLKDKRKKEVIVTGLLESCGYKYTDTREDG
jgi:hypothetical protein